VPFFSSSYSMRDIGAIGDSILAAATFLNTAVEWIRTNPPYYSISTVTNTAVGGSTSWWGLAVNLATVVAADPDVVVIEHMVNDQYTDFYAKVEEALIRKVRTALPSARLIYIAFTRIGNPAVDDATNLDDNKKQRLITLANHYGQTVADYDLALQAAVAGGGHCATYMSDTVHPTAAGHALAATVLEPVLLAALGGSTPGALPARVYNCAEFEVDPVIRNGVANDGETGTWSTSGTSKVSSAAGSTISFTGSMVSCGIETADGAIEWNIDGGSWTALNLASYGSGVTLTTSELARASHTVIIKVVSGTVQIDKFISL
jgi:lysophospholipase L1-like esterase